MKIAVQPFKSPYGYERFGKSKLHLKPSQDSGLIVVEAQPDPDHQGDREHLMIVMKALVHGSADQKAIAMQQVEDGDPESALENFFHAANDGLGSFELNPGVVLEVNPVISARGGRTLGATEFRGADVSATGRYERFNGLTRFRHVERYAGALVREYAPAVLLDPTRVLDGMETA